MAATSFTRTTLFFITTFWILQLVAVISHLSFITFWIGFLGAKSNVGILKYVYSTLLISAFFFLVLPLTEIILYFRSSLSLERYHKLQFIKIRLVLVEMLAFAILCHGVDNLIVWKVLALTACSRLPFNLCVGFAIVLKRKERKRLEMETKELGEETPLLNEE